jgi:hypothetical protein
MGLGATEKERCASRLTSACSERALWINWFYVQDIGASLMRGVRRHFYGTAPSGLWGSSG